MRNGFLLPVSLALCCLVTTVACSSSGSPGDSAPAYDGHHPDIDPESALVDGPDDLRGNSIDSLGEFYAPGRFYLVAIEGWDPEHMTPQSLESEVETVGAVLSIYLVDPHLEPACPIAQLGQDLLVHRTSGFSLRTRGGLTRGTAKSSYKIRFLSDDDRLLRMHSLNLMSMWNDVSQMREALAWQIFREVGVHASGHAYGRFCVNGQYFGLYSIIQQVDKTFLRQHFSGDNNDGNLYKGTWGDLGPAELDYRQHPVTGDDGGRQYYQSPDPEARTYSQKTNEHPTDPPEWQTYDDLARLVRVIHGVEIQCAAENCFNTEVYRQSVERIFDVYTFLRWAGANALLGSWDNYWGTPANYYLYNSGTSGGGTEFMEQPYFHWIPWDYDNCLGIDYFEVPWYQADIVDWPAITRQAYHHSRLPLLVNILRNEVFLQYYLDHIDYMMDAIFTEAWFEQQIGASGEGGLWDLLEPSALLEAEEDDSQPFTGRQFTNNQLVQNGYEGRELWQDNNHSLGILQYVHLRRQSVESQLVQWRQRFPTGSSGVSFPQQPGEIPELSESE
ncbi:MAG: CotH kinase family protein [Bradymonadales bacterium]|nr:CotH kinase family protein [Bradymonadales bacterium]